MSDHTSFTQLPLFDTVKITLTKGYSCVVDAIDGDLIRLKWVAWEGWTSGPYAHHTPPTNNGVHGRPIAMHRIILERMLGRLLTKGETVDHIDRNGLNNRRSNLRLADHSTNAMNSKKRTDNVSGYKGVALAKGGKKWRAYIRLNGKQLHLGLFATPELAHAAYCEAALKYHGEFARTE